MVEFAFVGVLVVLLLTGIITFGLLLSFKQDMTRAAAEGARAGAVAASGEAYQEAADATMEAVRGFDKDCGADDGLTCNIDVHACSEAVEQGTPIVLPVVPVTVPVTLLPSDPADDPTSEPQCVTVELVYDHDEFPLLPEFPILSAMLPDEMRDSSVARIG